MPKYIAQCIYSSAPIMTIDLQSIRVHSTDAYQNISSVSSFSLLLTWRKLLKEYGMEKLVEALRYKPEGRGFDSRRGSLEFFALTQSLELFYVPGVSSYSNNNEYQGYRLGVKTAGAWG